MYHGAEHNWRLQKTRMDSRTAMYDAQWFCPIHVMSRMLSTLPVNENGAIVLPAQGHNALFSAPKCLSSELRQKMINELPN